MTGITIKHAFQSAKTDGSDVTEVQPSNWNASHNIQMDSGFLVGNMSGGFANAQEIALTAFMQAALNSVDLPTLLTNLGLGGFSTGDVKLTVKNVADVGWVLMNDGTFGSASSGAGYANDNAQALFTLLYNNTIDSDLPVQTSAGGATTRGAQGTAAAAWAANCRMSLPKVLGRALAGAGAGSGLTARNLGTWLGAETHVLSSGELPSHTHGFSGATSGQSADHTHVYVGYGAGGFGNDANASATSGTSKNTGGTSNDHTHSYSGTTDVGTGGGAAHTIMQPSSFFNVMIKL